jgi:hypothetical protein
MDANRALGSALFSGHGPPGVAAQNRRGLSLHEAIREARRVFRPTVPSIPLRRPFAGAPIRPFAVSPYRPSTASALQMPS